METNMHRPNRSSVSTEQFNKLTTQPTFNVDEAAIFLGCSRETVRRLAAKKTLPSFRLGRRVLFSRVGIEEFIAKKSISV